MTTALVLGGGITGLTAVYELEKQLKGRIDDVEIILAEGSSRLGGKIRTVNKGGFIMETGADSIVSRKLHDSGIIDELSLNEDLVYNSVGTSYLFSEGELKQIPKEAVFGIPVNIESLAKSELLSAEGKVEALKDFYVNDKKFTNADSIGEFLTYYLGKEMVEKQISPVLSGVYSGDLNHLTISSTLPYLLEYKEKYGSIIKGLEANKDKFLGKDDKKFLSFQGGLETIIKSLESKLTKTDVLLNKKAVQIEKEGERYKVYFEDGEIILADYVILGIPHTEAVNLFQDQELASYFTYLKESSLISVYIGFNLSDRVLPADGTGFITTKNNELYCNACTWTSRKWQHTSKEGNLLVRLFYKSSHPKFEEISSLAGDELLQIALADIEKSLNIKGEPVVYDVTKWTDQMPTYQITHPKTVAAIETSLAKKYTGVFIAGSSYYGAGIPDCMENGRNVANKIAGEILKEYNM